MFVGLTGQIGAGKSTAARILESFGAVVIDADEIGRAVVEESLPLRRKLAEAFGEDVLTEEGEVDRRRVAERAFATDDSRRTLNQLVHPFLLKSIDIEMRRLSKQPGVVVVDAALLLEWGLDRQMDVTLVIEAPEEIRLARLAARGIDPEDARARQELQGSAEEFRSRAGHVICNDGSTEDLRAKLEQVWRTFPGSRGTFHG